MSITTYYKAVDINGVSFFPVEKDKRLNWAELVGGDYALGDEEGFEKAVAALRKGETVACTKHLLHGYADIDLAHDFGQRQSADTDNEGYRVISFEGEPVAELSGSMLLNLVPWDKTQKERFADAVKYGFRSVHNIQEVPVV